jgi:hypothetical protein
VKVQKVSLDSVLFADGEFVGPDKGELFRSISIGFGMGKEVALKNLLDPDRLKGAPPDPRAILKRLRNART